MKHRYLFLLCAAAALLSGCSGKIASAQPPQGTTAPITEAARGGLKTGLGIVASTAGSKNADPGSEGSAQTVMTMVALTLDESGTIDQCIIDSLQADVRFDESGALLTDPKTQVVSKNALGQAYGLQKASSIGREWSEQAAAFAEYVRGRTMEEVRSIALDNSGKPGDAELVASVTISVNDFIAGIEAAAASAADLGAQKGDVLRLASMAGISGSSDGKANFEANISAVTFRGDVVSSCVLDAVQTNVEFDTGGRITGDPAAPVLSKNQLGRSYGMHTASSIGKDWNEQAAAFAAYAQDKTANEIAGIAADDGGRPADAELRASVTIRIDDFQRLIAKAVQAGSAQG